MLIQRWEAQSSVLPTLILHSHLLTEFSQQHLHYLFGELFDGRGLKEHMGGWTLDGEQRQPGFLKAGQTKSPGVIRGWPLDRLGTRRERIRG
jgi:hypothetical protein